MSTLRLTDLVGSHVVDGVGEYTPPGPLRSFPDLTSCWQPARAFLLRIDDRVYAFHEPPGSHRRWCVVEPLAEDHEDVRRVARFAARTCHFAKRAELVKVEGREDRRDDVLVMTDDKTRRVLLEIGAEGMDAYYATFVLRWLPDHEP